jgi:hypothetical protein
MRVARGQEFVIGGYTVGASPFDALIFGYYDGDRFLYAARTRNGFTPATRVVGQVHHGRLEGVSRGGRGCVRRERRLRDADEDLRRGPAGREALQPGDVPRMHRGDGAGHARPETHQHVVRRAAEPHDAHVDAPVYPPDERVLKEVENHAAAIALYFMYYNFGRIHQTLRVTPAMEAGVANHVWTIEEIVGLLG